MRTESIIKQEFIETKHSPRYVELRRISETTCFEVISVCNRFSNANYGFEHLTF